MSVFNFAPQPPVDLCSSFHHLDGDHAREDTYGIVRTEQEWKKCELKEKLTKNLLIVVINVVH